MKVNSRYMKKHLLFALTVGGSFEIARAAALDLNSTARFLLDMLHIRTAMPDYLCAQVEALDRFQINRYLSLRPFALPFVSNSF